MKNRVVINSSILNESPAGLGVYAKNVIQELNRFDNYLVLSPVKIEGVNVEEISKIEEKLKNMKKIDKTIFLDFYYSFKSIKDIAKEQKISEFSVKQRLYRIRNKIRKEGK